MWSVDKAEHSLRDHAAWRSEFPINSVSEVRSAVAGLLLQCLQITTMDDMLQCVPV